MLSRRDFAGASAFAVELAEEGSFDPKKNITTVDDDVLTDVGEGCKSWSTMYTASWSSSCLSGEESPLAAVQESDVRPFDRFGALAKRAKAKAEAAAQPPKAPNVVVNALPSVGSVQHTAGQCKPCAWFYKPGSCQNGHSCNHCHLCEEGEHKRRKQAKIAGILGKNSDTDQATPAPEAPTVPSSPAMVEEHPDFSVGSIGHGTGNCQPCAWFWKPSGCSNGRDCGRCHRCPEGEAKARKKSKIAAMRCEKRQQAEEWTAPQSVRAGRQPAPTSPAQPPAPAVAELRLIPHDVAEIEFLRPPPGLAMPFQLECGASDSSSTTAEEHSAVETRAAEVSIGSAGHLMGECQPCAWFWKLGGCVNGKDCRRCHLCPEGEIKERKKAKKIGMRKDAASAAQGFPKAPVMPEGFKPPPGLPAPPGLPQAPAESPIDTLLGLPNADDLMCPMYLPAPAWRV